MFYVDLPWYALVIWAVFALIVLLPWIALPIIGISAILRGLLGYKETTARAPVGFQLRTQELGLTMADGGEKVEKDSTKKNSENS